MARRLVLAGIVAFLAPLACAALIFFRVPFAASLLSIGSASSAANSATAVSIPQPLSLQPVVSSERALNTLPLWHGRLDEDVMANPPPPFFARAPFVRKSSTLRSATEFSSNAKGAGDAGVQDSYASLKAQYVLRSFHLCIFVTS